MKPRAFACILAVTALLSAEEPSLEQIAEWQKLYPKLNSKMARMEEILNYIDRFLDDEEFTTPMLERAVEFKYLVGASLENIPEELPPEDLTLYKKALLKTEILGEKLYSAIELKEAHTARQLFIQLDSLRRKSHARWVY